MECIARFGTLVFADDESVANRVEESTNSVPKTLDGVANAGQETPLRVGFSGSFTLDLLPQSVLKFSP